LGGPTRHHLLPAVLAITIDHVLTRNAVASWIMTIDVTGSDHRSLLANIAVPVDPVSTG
jgi:endonuclease/exonuclease/phosphatase (EEP) superfamily protein YafD